MKVNDLGADIDGDNREGELDIYEFLMLMAIEIKEAENPPEELEEAFLRFGAQDVDEDITPEQLRETIESKGYKMTDHELELLVHQIDTEGNRRITFKDFISYFMMK